jgi:putative sigma-54 modulation protein
MLGLKTKIVPFREESKMRSQFSFKHMKSSSALSTYATDKIFGRIEKLATKPIESHITFIVEGGDHKAHCSVKGGDGFNFEVEAISSDMYSSVDLLSDKLYAQLVKQKEKLKNHKNGITLKNLKVETVPALDDCDSVPVDAKDMLKFEKARKRATRGV